MNFCLEENDSTNHRLGFGFISEILTGSGQVIGQDLDFLIIRMLLPSRLYVVEDGFMPCNVMNNQNNI